MMEIKMLTGIQRLWLASLGVVFFFVLLGDVNLVQIPPLNLAYFIADITNWISYGLHQNGFNASSFVLLMDAIAVSIIFGALTWFLYFVGMWVAKGFKKTGDGG
jgi:ABC-type Fe3+-siderophore transport system permease subunit